MTTAIGIGTHDFQSILCLTPKRSNDISRSVAYEVFSAGVAIITWRKTLAVENYTNFPDHGLTGRHKQYSLLAQTASFLYTP